MTPKKSADKIISIPIHGRGWFNEIKILVAAQTRIYSNKKKKIIY